MSAPVFETGFRLAPGFVAVPVSGRDWAVGTTEGGETWFAVRLEGAAEAVALEAAVHRALVRANAARFEAMLARHGIGEAADAS